MYLGAPVFLLTYIIKQHFSLFIRPFVRVGFRWFLLDDVGLYFFPNNEIFHSMDFVEKWDILEYNELGKNLVFQSKLRGVIIMNKQLTVLLIEDDVKACTEIERYADQCDDIDLAAITNNSTEALELTKYHMPDAIILDLELHHGGGNGFLYLQGLPELNLTHMPFILVTTNNSSTITYEYARKLGADFILAKYESDYSAQYVVEFLRMMQDVILSRNADKAASTSVSGSPESRERKLRQRIQRELDLVGINPKSVGYRYLIDAIAMIYHKPEVNLACTIAVKYQKSDSSVERAMQNAINSAWRHTDIEDLLKYYTARIHSDKAVPTTMEFVYYYANKLKNEV